MLFRRRAAGVLVGDNEFDLVNGGTSEKRRVGLAEAAERNNVFTLSLSIRTCSSFALFFPTIELKRFDCTRCQRSDTIGVAVEVDDQK